MRLKNGEPPPHSEASLSKHNSKANIAAVLGRVLLPALVLEAIGDDGKEICAEADPGASRAAVAMKEPRKLPGSSSLNWRRKSHQCEVQEH